MSSACSRRWSSLGAPLLRANFPRAFLDVNREPFELDPRMFEGRLPAFANTRSMRVAGGLGHGSARRRRRPGNLRPAAAGERGDGADRRALQALSSRPARPASSARRGRHGHCVLIDCHSMPSSSLGRDAEMKADVVLGDRYGTACAPDSDRRVRGGIPRPGLSRGAQQALCGRLHHRALRRAESRAPRAADRGQSRALHERGEPRDRRRVSRARRRPCASVDRGRRVRTRRSRCRVGWRRSSPDRRASSRRARDPAKKKGHSRRSGPKSREETPKKGCGTATPSRSRNAQNKVRRTRSKAKSSARRTRA